jgi:glutamyl-Q tRNA(Asp) synthetase
MQGGSPAPETGRGAARPVGRFAPSPTGALHAGSLVAALASWLDARAAGGRWLVRIEDVDTPRCVAGAAGRILGQLADLGLLPDEVPWVQSSRSGAYATALERLLGSGRGYPCGCTRREIQEAASAAGRPRGRDQELVYPGTCRNGLAGRAARAVRLQTTDPLGHDVHIAWDDRRLGPQAQNLTQAVGDFVLRRADGLWAYQLAVVVDDAAQGVTDVVRGEDLADNTPRQLWLQRQLGLPAPRYLHTPLVMGADGHKLSKQNGAVPADTRDARAALRAAGHVLGLVHDAATAADWRAEAVARWPTITAAWAAARPSDPSEPRETAR